MSPKPGGRTGGFPDIRETTSTVAMEQEIEHLLHLIMQHAAGALGAERSTLLLLDRRRGELWSKVAQGLEIDEIRMPAGTGIAGHVAGTGETVNLLNVYDDPRFNGDVDRRTGYRTRSMLCMPLRGPDGTIVGVIQVLNKRGEGFTAEDERWLASLCAQAAVLVTALTQAAGWDGIDSRIG